MACRRHHVHAKHILQERLEAIFLRTLDDKSLTPEDKQRLKELAACRKVNRHAKRDQARTTVQQATLQERLSRYPVDDEQVAPTRLGNAIRRLEEYGYDRYQLDSQTLWYELTAAAPKPLSRQVDTARAGVDFFVCLLYGQLLVAVAALGSLGAADAHYLTLLVTALVLLALALIW